MLRLQQTPKAFPGCQLTNSDYEVQINGQPCAVRACRVSAMPFNRIWPGHQRPLDQTELASYISFESDLKTIAGAYFDHESETAGLGAKIKDDPSFQAEFIGEKPEFDAAPSQIFEIVKGGAPKDAEGKSVVDNEIDAISGATMTSQGLDAAIDTWLAAYSKYFLANKPAKQHCGNCQHGHHHGEGEEEGEHHHNHEEE